MKITLSLSGGGLRGAAHVGVIKFLEEQGIEITAVAGSSAGAIVGLFLALGKSSDDMYQFLKDLQKRDLFTLGKSTGIFTMSRLEDKLRGIVSVDCYSQLDIPLYTCVTDISDGECHYINSGDPIAYTIASSTITPLFEAKKINNTLYIDGGFSDNLPVKPLKRYSEKNLAININPLRSESLDSFKSLLIRSILIMIRSNSMGAKRLSDAYLEVEGVANMHLFEFSEIDSAYESGYNEIKSSWDKIYKKLQ